jgi:hypothetical protein
MTLPCAWTIIVRPRPQPTLIFGPAPAPKRTKLRLQIDVNPTDRDQEEELERLLSLGARKVDVGQTGEESWHVPADPEGNEFCLLRRRLDPVQAAGPLASVQVRALTWRRPWA